METFTSALGMDTEVFKSDYLQIDKPFNLAKEDHPVNSLLIKDSNELLRERQNIFLNIYSAIMHIGKHWYDDVPLVFEHPTTGKRVYTMNSTQLNYNKMTVISKCRVIERTGAVEE